jgi:hypothetical protein
VTDPLEYQEITKDEYAEQAARTFTVTKIARHELLLTGPCPRCAAVVQIPVVTGVYKTFRGFAAFEWMKPQAVKQPVSAVREEPCVCTCDEAHPNRPAGHTGCGAQWQLRLTESA